MWRAAILPTGLGRSQHRGYWGDRHTQGFYFIQCVLMGSSKRSSSSTHKKRGGSRNTKLHWQCANLPFQLLDLTVFFFYFIIPSPPSLSSYSLVSFVAVVQPVQTSSRSALLLICQPLIAPSSLVLSVCFVLSICFWVLL